MCDLVTASDRREEQDIYQGIALFPDLNRLEMQLLEMMRHQQIEVDKYLIGPSFRKGHLQAFTDHLNAGMPLLKDAYIALAPLLVGNQELQLLAKGQHVGLKRAAAAVASLRFLEVHHDHDLSMILIFGMIMVTFALHQSGGEAVLCSYILRLVKPIYDGRRSLTRPLSPDCLSFLICLIGTETAVCLVQGQVPTIRIRSEDVDQLVDRFIGVSGPILPYFYDICELAQRIRLSGCRYDKILMDATAQAELDKIEQLLDKWQPIVPADFLTGGLTPAELISILAQAKVLRMVAMLIIHRLRYAFGDQDDKARVLSNVILYELDLGVRLTRRSFPFGDLAFLVASFEIMNPLKRQAALTKLHLIVDFSPRLRDEMEAWIVCFWAARDKENGPTIYWEDIASYLGD